MNSLRMLFSQLVYLLYHGNRTEKAISAYEKTIVLKPDFGKPPTIVEWQETTLISIRRQ